MDNAPTKKQRKMAARSRIVPMGSRDNRGRLLPLRYRVADEYCRRWDSGFATGRADRARIKTPATHGGDHETWAAGYRAGWESAS